MKKSLLGIWMGFVCLTAVPKAEAFVFYDLTPLIQMAPQFCAQCIPSAITELTTTYQQAYQMRDKFKSIANVGTLTKMAKNYGMHMGKSMLKKFVGKAAKKKLFSTSRTIKANSLANMDDEESVKQAIKKLFLQYPSDKSDQIREYSTKLTSFQVDSLVEMYVSSEDLKKKLDGLMETLDKIEMCVLGGSDSENKEACSETGMEEFQCNKTEGGSQEDEMCFERNALLAVQIYDKIMIYNEYLTAMLAQHQMTMSLGKRPAPLPYEKTSDKDGTSGQVSESMITPGREQHSFLHEFDLPLKAKSFIGGEIMAFASAEFDEIDNPQGYVKALEGKENEFESLRYLEHAHNAALEAVKAHNMKQQLPGYKKVLNSYKNMKELHDKAVEKLTGAEQCTINYIGKFYKDPCVAWYGKKCSRSLYDQQMVFHYDPEKDLKDSSPSDGVMDVICSDDSEHLCYVESVTKVKGQKGLKAYLLALYENAKNEDAEQEQSAYFSVDNTQTDIEVFLESGDDSSQKIDELNLPTDRYMVQQDDDEMKNMKKSSDFDKHARSKYDKYKDEGSPSELIKPSTQEEVYAEERKDSLMNWTLGSLTSREMIKDIVSGGKDFGQVNGIYPLWNDQKEFYDQYITGKYENIKTYFKKVAEIKWLAAISNVLMEFMPIGMDEEDSLKKTIADLTDFDDASVSSQIDEVLTEEKTELQKLKDNYEGKIRSFAAEKASLYKQLDNHNEKLNAYRKQYNESNEVIQDSEQVVPEMKDAIEVGNDLYKDRKEDERPTTVSPQNKEIEKNIQNQETKLKDAKQKKEEADRDIKGMKTNVTSLQKRIENLDEIIEQERAVYVREVSDLISEYKEKVDSILSDADEKTSVADYAIKQFPVIRLAQSMLQAVQSYIIAQVDLTEEKILDSLHQSGKLYYPQYHDQILVIHNEMIDKITNMTLEDVREGLESLLPETLASQKDAILEAVIGEFKNICEGDYCTTPDEEYYIGITAKKRDLKAPKAPVDFSSAPLREVFHFDVQDYDSIDKWFDESKLKKNETVPADYNEVIITGESFLNGTMEDIPEIWKYILRHRAYVEKDFDLSQLFDRVDVEKQDVVGSAEQELIRSGVYPCLAGTQNVDATVSYGEKYPFGYTVSANAIKATECQNVHREGNAIWDNEVDAGQNYAVASVDSGKNSELSQILSYVIDHRFDRIIPIKGPKGEEIENVVESTRYKLTFNRALQRGIHVMQKLEESNSENKAADAQHHFIQRMLLEQNQMGSYLDFMEMEQVSREALEGVAVEVQKLTEDLKAFYEEMGYTWSDDFDLSNESDFEKAAEVLDQIKEVKMTTASNQLAKVKGISDKVQHDTREILNILTVLQLDGNEMLVLSGDEIQDVGDDVEFLEKIKTAEADMAIGDEYADRGDDEYKNRLKHMSSPYCSSYSIDLGL